MVSLEFNVQQKEGKNTFTDFKTVLGEFTAGRLTHERLKDILYADGE